MSIVTIYGFDGYRKASNLEDKEIQRYMKTTLLSILFKSILFCVVGLLFILLSFFFEPLNLIARCVFFSLGLLSFLLGIISIYFHIRQLNNMRIKNYLVLDCKGYDIRRRSKGRGVQGYYYYIKLKDRNNNLCTKEFELSDEMGEKYYSMNIEPELKIVRLQSSIYILPETI